MILQTILLMLIVLDSFGNIVLVNSLLLSRGPSVRRQIILRECLVAMSWLLLLMSVQMVLDGVRAFVKQ